MIIVPRPRPLSALLAAAAERLAADLARLSGAPPAPPEAFAVQGDPSVPISSLAAAFEAEAGSLCFAVSPQYVQLARSRGAAAVIASPDSIEGAGDGGPAIVPCREPRLLFAVILGLAGEDRVPAFAPGEPFFKDKASAAIGRGVFFGPGCYVGADVSLGDGVVVGPGVFIEDGVSVGERTILHPRVVLRWGVKIGRDCQIHSGTVVGEDGFGYNQVPFPKLGRLVHYKNPHLGGVSIGDDVEIGALSAIDRGLVGDTVVGRGTKIDNLVQIGHNCQVGEDCVVVAQVGMGGHSRIGSRAFLLGQVGLTHGSDIGEDAILAGQAGVLKKVPAGRQVWTGTPAQPQAEEYRGQLLVRNDLPKWRRFLSLLRKGLSFEEIREAVVSGEPKGAGRPPEK
jgi:UDP-3-O-[3-hydroxymyristoyl] glucosamine N-acyltransferase